MASHLEKVPKHKSFWSTLKQIDHMNGTFFFYYYYMIIYCLQLSKLAVKLAGTANQKDKPTSVNKCTKNEI